MVKKINQIDSQETSLYNNILLLSRNKIFYTKFGLSDTFQNRIHLIFIHASFLIIKSKKINQNVEFKDFYQKFFDLIFNKIELNMREIGHGDVSVNKNMKFLTKVFYNILLNCEDFTKKSLELKNAFLFKFLERNSTYNNTNNGSLIDYFNKYQAFCFDLSPDSVIKGKLNFKYK
jgi:cytochrome b pre-mRNA-processing protein 3